MGPLSVESAGWPLVSHDPAIQAHYEHCRREGTSHSLAEMFALGQPPTANTDREFLEGHCNGNQFEQQPHVGDAYREDAVHAGVDVTGKIYLSGLAAFPGDPRAWVSGRGDVQKVCEERGWDCDGAVKVRSEKAAPAPVRLAEDLVQGEVEQILATVPEPARVDREDLAEQVREKRQPHWKD